MSLLVRDNRIIFPAVQQGTVVGALAGLVLVGAASSITEPIDVGTFTEMLCFLFTSAHGGTSPTLDVKMQYGWKDANNQFHWLDSGDAFAQLTTSTGDGVTIKKAMTANFGKYVRFILTMGGTANPTYTTTLAVALKG